MWFDEILCGGSCSSFPWLWQQCVWVVSKVISVKFAYSGALIQTARHHNARSSVTHNDCVWLELVIFVSPARSVPCLAHRANADCISWLELLTFRHLFSYCMGDSCLDSFYLPGGSDGCASREWTVSLLQRSQDRASLDAPRGTLCPKLLASLLAPVRIYPWFFSSLLPSLPTLENSATLMWTLNWKPS